MKRTLSFVVIALATLSMYSRAQSAGNAGNNHNNPNAQQYSALLESFHRQTHLALDPIVRITSPLADSMVSAGEGKGQGNGSPFGTNFLVTLEMVERDSHRFVINEATEAPPVLGIRDVPRLLEGEFNLSVPGLYFFFDADLITPDGHVLPAFQNFASAFNVAGSDDTPGKGVTTWLGWHVLESLRPGTKQVTLTAVVVDNGGRIGLDQITLNTDQDHPSGELLTPLPSSYPGNPLTDDELGPEVSMIAPRVPTSIAIGPTDNTLNTTNGALFFIHVSALDRKGDGIAVSVTGVPTNPVIPAGLIFDPTQIPLAGPNRNYPGLNVTFDVDLRQPNGNIVPAGTNLAPLFDVAGNEVDASGAIRTSTDWVVGGSLVLPEGKNSVTIIAKVADNAGHTGSTKSILSVSPTVSGQSLTPNP
jgi:hypothetical protein